MIIQIVQTEKDFQNLQSEWDELLLRSSSNTIFLTWEWLYSWWEAYAVSGDQLYILTVRDPSNRLIGAFPFFRRAARFFGVLRIRTLRFIGDGSNDSDYLDAILDDGQEEQILSAMWRFLRDHSTDWDVMELSGIPETSPTVRWLEGMGKTERLVWRRSSFTCAVTTFPSSWEEYLKLLKPRFRTKVRSTLRRLEDEHQIEFRTIDREDGLATGLESLFDLHAKRWALKGRHGVFVLDAKRRFYEAFAVKFLKRGWLAFDFLELDGKVAACQMCFSYANTIFLLQEAFNPEFGAESVGIALRAMVFKKAIEEGIKSYDFLAGEGRHKAQWEATIKSSQTFYVGNRTLRNIIYLRLPVLVDAYREQLKAVLPRKVLEIRSRLIRTRAS